jgi:uncharacterized damage-inducible protein DinB
MNQPFPEPTRPVGSRTELFLDYLDFFRSKVLDKVTELPESELRHSRLPSGWTPVELVKHLTFVEMRWLEWGFEGRQVAEPWGDSDDERWHVPAEESLNQVTAALVAQGERSRALIKSHDLSEIGQPGPRWDGGDPPTLERILFHLLQEYARHVGHLDIVAELVDGSVGE